MEDELEKKYVVIKRSKKKILDSNDTIRKSIESINIKSIIRQISNQNELHNEENQIINSFNEIENNNKKHEKVSSKLDNFNNNNINKDMISVSKNNLNDKNFEFINKNVIHTNLHNNKFTNIKLKSNEKKIDNFSSGTSYNPINMTSSKNHKYKIKINDYNDINIKKGEYFLEKNKKNFSSTNYNFFSSDRMKKNIQDPTNLIRAKSIEKIMKVSKNKFYKTKISEENNKRDGLFFLTNNNFNENEKNYLNESFKSKNKIKSFLKKEDVSESYDKYFKIREKEMIPSNNKIQIKRTYTTINPYIKMDINSNSKFINEFNNGRKNSDNINQKNGNKFFNEKILKNKKDGFYCPHCEHCNNISDDNLDKHLEIIKGKNIIRKLFDYIVNHVNIENNPFLDFTSHKQEKDVKIENKNKSTNNDNCKDGNSHNLKNINRLNNKLFPENLQKKESDKEENKTVNKFEILDFLKTHDKKYNINEDKVVIEIVTHFLDALLEDKINIDKIVGAETLKKISESMLMQGKGFMFKDDGEIEFEKELEHIFDEETKEKISLIFNS